jgi:DNA primase large subunit
LLPKEYIAVLDPFSEEAREIIGSSPPVEELPEEIRENAVKRVAWKTGEMRVGPDTESVRKDVLSFYLMCQSVASVSYPYSREVRAVSESTRNTIRYRMYDLYRSGMWEECLRAVGRSMRVVELDALQAPTEGLSIPKSDLIGIRALELQADGIDPSDRIADQYEPRYAVRWIDLAPLLKYRRAELTRMYLVRGWSVITLRDMWNLYANFIAVKTEEYIQSVYERILDSGVPRDALVSIGRRIVASLPRAPPGVEGMVRGPSRRLNPEFFPPCVKSALAGTGAGLRNYAVSVLLTSFLSYARLSPPPSAVKITDVTTDLSVVREEIVPMIFEAAERCNPPLFSDQPQEKGGIFYHLGFGMTTNPTPADSGKSKWYRPPNCAKIQMSAPPLCVPDELCRSVKNPLTYYFRKIAEERARR